MDDPDDSVDIQMFDVVAWLHQQMTSMLREEMDISRNISPAQGETMKTGQLTAVEFIEKMIKGPGWRTWYDATTKSMVLHVTRQGEDAGMYYSPGLPDMAHWTFRDFRLCVEFLTDGEITLKRLRA